MHGVSAEQNIKGCKLEWIHIHSQRHFNKVKMECESEATENFKDELRIRRKERISVDSVEVEWRSPGESDLDGSLFRGAYIISVDL